MTLERLDALAEAAPPTRIGLSATQKPIETIARLLVGASSDRSAPDGAPACAIVDVGHRRALELELCVPDGELEAVMPAEQFGDLLDDVAAQAEKHRTTLVFSNTRRLAERVAHLLEERLGEGRVSAHHGSLSKDRRLKVEEIEPIHELEIVTIIVLVLVFSNLFGKLMTRFVEAPAQRRIRDRLGSVHWRRQV